MDTPAEGGSCGPREPLSRLRLRGSPLAHPDAVVRSGQARFAVLTPRLLRLQWSETGIFDDRSSYAFPTRHAPVPSFSRDIAGDDLIVDTGALRLRYRQDSGPFRADNLTISFELDGHSRTWRPGTVDRENLRGTRRTLDLCEGDAALEPGLLSRAGWFLFDDSQTVRFGEDGWVQSPPLHSHQDWYFFGYGHDYKAALTDYSHFGGTIPLIPRFVLGAWWSRYWAYSAEELQELVHDFEAHGLPLDVLVVDMDWHTPHSWTGYTWNRKLFPDPPAFLQWVHQKGLRVTLNLHPAEGVQAFEEVYPRFAAAMGVDPSSGDTIPFRIADRRFVQNYFELLHHPLEDEGIDFWWVDWQQGEASELKGLDPLPWLNHLHFQDSRHRGRRPLLYSRWGGLGNHRYPIGFSGDTIAIWEALQFQPYFTATAANVCFGWWSHDIGGHMGGATEPELYARWVQFGALSPCLRLHATKDSRAERRPWKYSEEVYRAAKAAFRWRYRLIPYIYTMARVAHNSGIPLCRPLYYEYPREAAAYVARYQYFFGDQMFAAPMVHRADTETGIAATDVWIPPGTWTDYTTKETFIGPRWVRLIGDLDRLPMLMKEGAILPLAAPFASMPEPQLSSGTTGALPNDHLILSVFPGEGRFCLYEDDGISEAYQAGQCEWTSMHTRIEGEREWIVQIEPVEGYCEALPRKRRYEIHLEGSQVPQRVTLDGEEVSDWTYDPDSLTTVVQVPPRGKGRPTTVRASADRIVALGEAHNRQVVLGDVHRLLGRHYPERCGEDSLDPLREAVLQRGIPGRADAIARLGGPFARVIEYVTPEEAIRQLGRVIVGAPAHGDEPYDLRVTFRLFQSDQMEQRVIRRKGVTTDLILPTPFAFDGRVRTMRWEAQVEIFWRGHTLTYDHRSRPLFPGIYAWQVLVHPENWRPLEEAMDEAGPTAPEWQAYLQDPATQRNLNQPHVVSLGQHYREQLAAGEKLAATLRTTITCPEQREARLLFLTSGPVALYLNGDRIVGDALVEEQNTFPFQGYSYLRALRQTAVFHLRAGENVLVVHSRPAPALSWYLGAAVTTPAGDVQL